MHLDWRPAYRYIYFLDCPVAHWVEVPVYKPSVKVLQGIFANGLFDILKVAQVDCSNEYLSPNYCPVL